MELTKEKKVFWDALRLPVEKNCTNCKHGKNPVCNRLYIRELGLDETRKDEWKWMWEWDGEE